MNASECTDFARLSDGSRLCKYAKKTKHCLCENIIKDGECPMTGDYPPKILHVISCINPGLSCCEHRLTGQKHAENVWRCEVYCGKWRGNRMRDRTFYACQPEYKVLEPEVIDAELYQKNRLSLRRDK